MPDPDSFSRVIIRYGEIAIKSATTRAHLVKLLARNVESCLRAQGIRGRAYPLASRIIVETHEAEAAAKVVAELPGVSSASPAVEVDPDLDALAETAVRIIRKLGASSFAIRAQRITKDYPLTSIEVNRAVGARVQRTVEIRVDLENPEVEIGIELIRNRAFVFFETHRGPGGLPLASQGKAILLLRGGSRGALAGWLVMRRGVLPIPVSLAPGRLRMKDVESVALLQRAAWPYQLRLLAFDPAPLMELSPECRLRALARLVEAIAAKHGASAVVVDHPALWRLPCSLPVLDPISMLEDALEVLEKEPPFDPRDHGVDLLAESGGSERDPAAVVRKLFERLTVITP